MDDEILPGEWSECILPEIWRIIAETCAKNAPYVPQKPGAFELFGADIGNGAAFTITGLQTRIARQPW